MFCFFCLVRVEYWFSCRFLITFFKKGAFKGLFKKWLIDRKLWRGGGAGDPLSVPCHPCSGGLGITNQFAIFKPWSYCFKETVGFDIKASFASRLLSRLIRWYNKILRKGYSISRDFSWIHSRKTNRFSLI